MLQGFKSFKSDDTDNVEEESTLGFLQSFYNKEFISFLESEEFEYNNNSNCQLTIDVPFYEDGDEKAWIKYCGSFDGSWYNKIFIRQNRIEACSEIECGGIYTNNNYWEYSNYEELKNAFNESVKWLKNIQDQ